MLRDDLKRNSIEFDISARFVDFLSVAIYCEYKGIVPNHKMLLDQKF